MMQVVFRADASLEIGTGHVMRCLTLAKALKENGAEVAFICRLHLGNLVDYIRQQGFRVYELRLDQAKVIDAKERSQYAHWLGTTQAEDAQECLPILRQLSPNWLIVDHYAIDVNWQRRLRHLVEKLMVIDDLCDRSHIADLLLNQNLNAQIQDYASFVPESCVCLIGPAYALLRSEFAQWRSMSLARRNSFRLKKILVNFGGVDPHNLTGNALTQLAISNLTSVHEVIVVLGVTAIYFDDISAMVDSYPYALKIHKQVSNMAELMSHADIAIGASGATTWERCALGLPSIQLVVADNQQANATALQQQGVAIIINQLTDLPNLLASINQQDWLDLSHKSAQMVDAQGCEGVVKELIGSLKEVKKYVASH